VDEHRPAPAPVPAQRGPADRGVQPGPAPPAQRRPSPVRPLTRFAVVGSATTAVDVGTFLLLWRGGRRSVVAADVPALVGAGAVSWALHRAVTFRHDPYHRWLSEHEAFVASGLAAGAVDVAVTAALLGVAGGRSTRAGLGAKLPAVAVAGGLRWALHRRVLFRIVRDAHVPRTDRPPQETGPRLSVVVPAFREEGRIGDAVGRIRSALAELGEDLEIVVVDDGSGDGTAAEADAAGADVVVVQPTNRGKGAAVRAGVLVASGRTVAFTDADLAYAPEQLQGLLEQVEAGWDVVVGSRRHDQTTTLVKARRLREIGGRVINFFTHAVLLGAYRDTQCGLKAFRADAARAIFERSRVDGFGFDVEVFVVAERNGMAVTEVPVTVENSTRSSVKVVRDASRLVADLFRIRRWAREGRYQAP
jgi:dolichyl-phosphate beta-glucosyltransferase